MNITTNSTNIIQPLVKLFFNKNIGENKRKCIIEIRKLCIGYLG